LRTKKSKGLSHLGTTANKKEMAREAKARAIVLSFSAVRF
jgi:hypothetical protein